jgi:hypothetical protein
MCVDEKERGSGLVWSGGMRGLARTAIVGVDRNASQYRARCLFA